MSGHLIGCAGEVDSLPSSHKLALLAFADSADDRTHIAFPGYDGVRKWANVSRSRAAELISDLVRDGFLQPYKAARRGQRAEYIVFPHGCCDLHRVPDEEPAVDLAAVALAAGVTVDQARVLLGLVASDQGVVQTPVGGSSPQPNGSDVSDSSPRNGSDPSDPNEDGSPETPAEAVDNPGSEGEWVQMGSDASDPFTTSTTTPLTPASGGASCARHQTPAPNCRGCGTTNRQRAEAAKRQAADDRRRAHQAAAAADRQPVAKDRDRVQAAINAAKTAARTTTPTTSTSGSSR